MTSTTLTSRRLGPTGSSIAASRRALLTWTLELVSGVGLAYLLIFGLSPYVLWPTALSSVSLLALAASAIIWWFVGQPVRLGWTLPAFAGLVTIGAMSAGLSIESTRSWGAWWQILTLGSVFLLCAGLFSGERQGRALSILLWAGALAMLWQWAQTVGWYARWLDINPGEWLPSIPYRLPNPNPVALQMVLLLLPALVKGWRGTNRARLWLTPYVLSLGALLFLSSSRGGWMGAAAALVVLLALQLDRAGVVQAGRRLREWSVRRPWLIVAALALITLVAIFAGWVLWRQLDQPSRGGRLEYWGPAIETFLGHPWLGQGPATFAMSYLRTQTAPPAMIYNQAHSLYFNTLAEGGALGLLAGIVMAGATARELWRRRSERAPETHAVVAIGLAALAAFAVHGLVDTVTFDKGNVVILAVLVASGFAVAKAPKRSAFVPGRTAVAAVTMLALGLGVYGIWRDDPAHQGSALATSGDWAGARAAFAVAVDRDAGSPAAWQQLGLSQAQLVTTDDAAMLNDAIQSLERAALLDPAWPANALNLGALYRAAGDHEQAVVWMERAVALAPRVALYQVNLGLAYEEAGAADQAAVAYTEALTLSPGYAAAPFWIETPLRVATLAATPATPPAVGGLAVATTRGVSDVYVQQAVAALAADDVAGARHWLDMADLGFWVQPEARLEWVWRLAEVAARQGDSTQALEMATEALTLSGTASSFGPGIDGGAVYGTYVALRPTTGREFVPQVVDLTPTIEWPERRAQARAWCADVEAAEAARFALCASEAAP